MQNRHDDDGGDYLAVMKFAERLGRFFDTAAASLARRRDNLAKSAEQGHADTMRRIGELSARLDKVERVPLGTTRH